MQSSSSNEATSSSGLPTLSSLPTIGGINPSSSSFLELSTSISASQDYNDPTLLDDSDDDSDDDENESGSNIPMKKKTEKAKWTTEEVSSFIASLHHMHCCLTVASRMSA
jgi:hypothetical protein